MQHLPQWQTALFRSLKLNSIPIGAASAVSASGIVQTPQSKVPRAERHPRARISLAGALPIGS
jgi:hypothetical protein